MNSIYAKLGVHIPEILLPARGTDLTKWAVIACDQFTSQPGYWDDVQQEAGMSPSTLKLTFPEIFLKDDDRDSRIDNINRTMEKYLDEGILEPQKPGFILVERSTPHTPSRKGLVVALDLECYDYRAGSDALIRATEGTVLDRIPPRVKIRENALIELPHIMVLIDDPDRTVIESLYARNEQYEKLYDFDLMMGGGHIKGWKVDDEESLTITAEALKKLAGIGGRENSACTNKNETKEPSPCSTLLFAVGDGNHSLASAKAHWENVKAALAQQHSSGAIPEHPARYALVELVNVHDDGLAFEPIHRVLINIDGAAILERLKNACKEQLCAEYGLFDSRLAMEAAAKQKAAAQRGAHHLPFILEGTYGLLTVQNPVSTLEVGTLQSILDELLKDAAAAESDKNGSAAIEADYIHGDEVVTEIGSKKGCMGFYLPVMSKHDLFRTVINDGVLPRKTFSMGEAQEKRYYLECRRIR